VVPLSLFSVPGSALLSGPQAFLANLPAVLAYRAKVLGHRFVGNSSNVHVSQCVEACWQLIKWGVSRYPDCTVVCDEVQSAKVARDCTSGSKYRPWL
jgi:hypothetical protein